MITHAIGSVVPVVSQFDGRLTSIAFIASSTDDSGNTVSKTVSEVLDTPVDPTDTGFTDDVLNKICDDIATKRDIYKNLDVTLSIKHTVYVPPPPPPVPTDAQIRADLTMRVDAAARQVYDRFTAFQVEYDPREAAAQAYKDAGYTGDPTIWVTDFTDNAGLTVQAGVDLILSQASTLRAAIQTLAGYRMRKYKITNADTLDLAQQEYNSIISDINTLSASLT